MTVTPELLAAFADGELDTETARTVEAEIAQSPALQAQLALHRGLRDRLAARFAPIAEEPVPEHLRQAVFAEPEAEVIDFAAAARKRSAPVLPERWGRVAGPALAASLVLALLGINFWPSSNYARGNLADALDGQLVTTQAADASVRVLISFRDKAGHYCRGFTGKTASGIACRDDNGWRLQELLGGTETGSTEYRQAGSEMTALMAQVQEMADGPALDADEEAAAARRGWRPASAQ